MRVSEIDRSTRARPLRRGRSVAAGPLVLWLLAAAAVSAGGEPLSDPVLEARLEVATLNQPYLVLDLAKSRLRLMSGGAVLRDYAVSAIEIGGSRVMFLERAARLPAPGGIWELERLDPARSVGRTEIVPPAPGQPPSPVEIPLEPEEALPAPATYRLSFHPGLSIEIAQDERARADPWWALFRRARWRIGELAESISPRPEVRLRLVLPASEAGALYRSLPMPLRLMVS